jgi:multidrug resistance efflux pump
MKKALFFSLASFVLGIAATAFVLSNPFGWEWMHQAGHRLMGGGEGDAEQSGQLWTCGMHPQVLQDKPGECPICGMKLVPVKGTQRAEPTGTKQRSTQGERKIKYWQAPMDPTFISDKPGKSPMGMDLIPVYEGEEDELAPGTIKIDPVFVQNIGVQSEEIQRTDIPFTIRTVGNLTYNDGQIAWVNTKYEGWIEKVYVNYVGEPVKKGQKLFEIYSPQLVTTQKEYLQALHYAKRMAEGDYPDIAERAQSLLNSARERLGYWDITAEQITELEKSRRLRRTLAVVSPANGLVVEKMDQALEGMYAKAGMNLYKIVDLSTIWIEVEVFENQIPWLKIGQRATIELPYEPGKKRAGRIRYLWAQSGDVRQRHIRCAFGPQRSSDTGRSGHSQRNEKCRGLGSRQRHVPGQGSQTGRQRKRPLGSHGRTGRRRSHCCLITVLDRLRKQPTRGDSKDDLRDRPVRDDAGASCGNPRASTLSS